MKQSIFFEIVKVWRKQFKTQLVTTLVLISTFTIMIGVIVFTVNIKKIVDAWGDSIQLTVYLNDELKESEITSLESDLSAMSYFSEVKYLSKEEAKRKFKESFSKYFPGMFESESLGNPLPASFDLVFNKKYLEKNNEASVSSIVEKISNIVGIDEVDHGQDGVSSYKATSSIFSQAGSALLIIMFITCVLIIGNSQRVTLASKKEEIAILELIGATKEMIRRPYIIQGAFMGGLAGLGALASSYILFIPVKNLFLEKGLLLGEFAKVSFLSVPVMIMLVFLTTSIGVLGAYIVVRKQNNGWSASEASIIE